MVKYLKLRKYERLNFLFTFCISLLVLIVFFLIYSFQNRISNYLLINGTISGDNLASILVTQKELDVLYKNKYLYFNNKKFRYKVNNVMRDAVIKNENYHFVVISFKIGDQYKINDNISIVIGNGRISFYKMFESMWKGV